MSNNFTLGNGKAWSRRQLLKLGLAGAGVTGAAALWQMLNLQSKSIVKVPPLDIEASDDVTNPMKMLRDFDYGTVKQENGRTIREFQLTAGTSIIKLNSAVSYNIWDLNGRIPGPTLRAKQGDRIRVLFLNNAGHSHSLHFHGVHPAEMDGVRPVSMVFIQQKWMVFAQSATAKPQFMNLMLNLTAFTYTTAISNQSPATSLRDCTECLSSIHLLPVPRLMKSY